VNVRATADGRWDLRTTNYTTPSQVSGLTGVAAIAAGDRHSMFLKGDSTL
jgi:hypothetical protein